jgi:hypothetical protein
MRIELRSSDGFLFFGSLIPHKVDDITLGKRNVIDMSTYHKVFSEE